jgi:hypothetical protein
MRSPVDAIRSVQHYVWRVLHENAGNDSWEVRFAANPGEFAYPFARVQAVGPPVTSGAALYYVVSQPMSIELYEAPREDEEESLMQAMNLQGVLLHGFRGEGVGDGRPLRIPLFDFDGVDLQTEGTERNPSDYLRVEDFAPRLLSDLQDPRRVAVVCDLRVTWRKDANLNELRNRRGEPVKGLILADAVNITYAPS